MGWLGSLGLVNANYYIWNGQAIGSYSTGNYVQSLGVEYDGRWYAKINMCVCVCVYMAGSLCYAAKIDTTL